MMPISPYTPARSISRIVVSRGGILAFFLLLLNAPAGTAGENTVERWAEAVGGRDRLAQIESIYREAVISVSGFEGTIRAWHTAAGQYRKEEQVATFSRVETFDGVSGLVQQGTAAPRGMDAAELALARSSAFANWSAGFFVFFPERHEGTVEIVADDSIMFLPHGGVEWQVTLDPASSLPSSMMHMEGQRTVNVDFAAYENVEGVTFEKEIHRRNGDPRFDAVIRFTKTVINPPIDESLFATAP
jgi:hypothetical protein